MDDTISEAHQSLNTFETSLPIEILANIIEELAYGHAKSRSTHSRLTRFTPRWYLTPLLQVSKLWYAAGVEYLYRTIAVGSGAPFEFTTIEGEKPFKTLRRHQSHSLRATHPLRKGHEVAEDLYRTLSTNSQLAALITKLQLGIEIVYEPQATIPTSKHEPEWTQTIIHILQVCPNVEHVQIRGFKHSELDALVDVLKEKSLVSFRITSRYLFYSYSRRENGGTFSQILDMMQKWPKLRSIRVEYFLDDKTMDDPLLDASQVSSCCPDLREIIITGEALHASEYRALRVMCSGGVAKIDVKIYGNRIGGSGNAAADALCECLRAWSPTLSYLSISSPDFRGPYRPLNEALSSLRELRELQCTAMKLDYGSISKLPWLERFSYFTLHSVEELETLSSHLEDLENFPSLNDIALILTYRGELGERLLGICRRRNIQLKEDWPVRSLTSELFP